MAYANAAEPLIRVMSDFWSFGRRCRGVRPGRKRRRLQVVRGFSITIFTICKPLEAAWRHIFVFWRRSAGLGGGLETA